MEHMFDHQSELLLAEILARLDDADGPVAQELDRLLVGLERVARQVEAAVLAVVAHADRGQHFVADGHRSVTSWQQALVNSSRSVALARTRSATVIRRAPEVGLRLASGEVGVEQVRALGRLAANPRCRERLFDHDEAWIPQLLDMAVALPLVDFRLVADRWEQLADSDGTGGDRAHRRRSLQLSIVGDTALLKGQFDAATGVVLKEILAVFEQAEFTTGDTRLSAGQRRADALVAALRAAVGGSQQVKVTVNLMVDADTMDSLVRQRPVDPGLHARCETLDGTALPPWALLSAALAGRVRTVVTDRLGVVTHLGRRRRLFSGAVREAARLAGIRCVWPGCGMAHTQVDHLDPWSRGGATDTHNAAPLCGWHNRWKHDHRYRITRGCDGSYVISRPDGTRLPRA